MSGIEIAVASAAIVSAAASAYGAISSVSAQSSAMRRNAQIQDRNARYARARAAADSERKRRDVDRILGRNRARVGAAGLDASGSIEGILADFQAEGELDALLMEHGGELEAVGREEQAAFLRTDASNVRAAGFLSATGALLGGVAKAGGPFVANAASRGINPSLGTGAASGAAIRTNPGERLAGRV